MCHVCLPGAALPPTPKRRPRASRRTSAPTAVTNPTDLVGPGGGVTPEALASQPNSVRINFSAHVNKSLYPRKSHPRRTLLTDLNTPVETPAEIALWHQLYARYTPNHKTNWQAMLIAFNDAARCSSATTPDQVLRTKHLGHMKQYLKIAASKEQQRVLTQPSVPFVLSATVANPAQLPGMGSSGAPMQQPQHPAHMLQPPQQQPLAEQLLLQHTQQQLMMLLQSGTLQVTQPTQQQHWGASQLMQTAQPQQQQQQQPSAAASQLAATEDAAHARLLRMQKLQTKASGKRSHSAIAAGAPASKRGGAGTPKRCKSCWNLRAGGGHKSWPEHCNHNCKACGRPMAEHSKPCNDPAQPMQQVQ